MRYICETDLTADQINAGLKNETMSLWRSDSPDYPDIVYATEQISKEEQLWPQRISS